METKEEILIRHGCPDVPFDASAIMNISDILKAMEEYADQKCEYLQKIFTENAKVLIELEDLYRKENPNTQGKYYIPDKKSFYKWIVIKIKKPDNLNYRVKKPKT